MGVNGSQKSAALLFKSDLGFFLLVAINLVSELAFGGKKIYTWAPGGRTNSRY